jgi:hypothetical protein
VYIITDNPMLARGIDADPIIIPSNGPLTALIAVLPLQVAYLSHPIIFTSDIRFFLIVISLRYPTTPSPLSF